MTLAEESLEIGEWFQGQEIGSKKEREKGNSQTAGPRPKAPLLLHVQCVHIYLSEEDH